MTQQNFQVNLNGMIDLLSNHLYSNPGVFYRELLQNGVDAIKARRNLGHVFEGKITIELYTQRTIAVHDNGIGLTEQEIVLFLAQIGHTSKRGNLDASDDYIGQFGVGLLACFLVSDEIVLITRSALEGEALEWRGKPDGTYTIRRLGREVPIGSTVYLSLKEDYEEYAEWYKAHDLIEHYGSFLETPIHLVEDGYDRRVNTSEPPWAVSREEALNYARNELNETCLDVIPLESIIGEVKGVAYILSHPVSLQAEKRHRVYLKNMLVSDRMESILPSWAFFATAIMNANGLRPTASREALYENDVFFAVQQELGEGIKRHFHQLAADNVELLQKIIRVHNYSLKALAVEEDESYQLFAPYFAFETSYGQIEAADIARDFKQVLVTATLDEFRQIARVAKAQELLVINGGYVHDYQLAKRLGEVYSELEVIVVDPLQFFKRFQELGGEDAVRAADLVALADSLLERFQCRTAFRWFEPAEIAVLYTTNEEIGFLRMTESSREGLNETFGEAVRTVTDEMYETPYAQLCFNYNNPIVRKMTECANPEIQALTIPMLYAQSLLLGNYPMTTEELRLMNESNMAFLNLGLSAQEAIRHEGTV